MVQLPDQVWAQARSSREGGGEVADWLPAGMYTYVRLPTTAVGGCRIVWSVGTVHLECVVWSEGEPPFRHWDGIVTHELIEP
jgi:hypothetical protein